MQDAFLGVLSSARARWCLAVALALGGFVELKRCGQSQYHTTVTQQSASQSLVGLGLIPCTRFSQL